MRKISLASFSLTSLLIAWTLVGLDSQLALACSGGGSSSSGLSHGSSLGSGSVTVCVGSSTSSPASSTTKTITKTVTVPVKVKTPAPKKISQPAAKKPTKPVATAPVTCPSSAQLSSMPRSADASERWVQSLCQAPASQVSAPKPTPKPAASTKTMTITETITIEIPGYSSGASDSVQFFPNPLTASVYPAKVLSIGQVATFSSNPIAHFGSANVLGRQAEVHFVPQSTGWFFSDGDTRNGSDTSKSFGQAGKFQVEAYVDYTVSYRLLGETNWQNVAGVLTVLSNTLEVLVGAINLKGDKATGAGLLVGQDCIQNPGSFGCDI